MWCTEEIEGLTDQKKKTKSEMAKHEKRGRYTSVP
jgi:hypothetical protein